MFRRYGVINSCLLAVLLIILLACQYQPYSVARMNAEAVAVDGSVEQDSLLEALVIPYRKQLKSEMDKIIGKASRKLSRGVPESLLTNFVADLMIGACKDHNEYKTPDVAVVNVKGLRIPLAEGDITVGDVFQLMPFENKIVLLKMPASQLEELFDFMASVGGEGLAGASFGINYQQAENILVGGKPLDHSRMYWVATSDYLADGGDYFTALTKAEERINTGLKVREAILEHIQKLTAQNKMVDSQLDQRIYHVNQ